MGVGKVLFGLNAFEGMWGIVWGGGLRFRGFYRCDRIVFFFFRI